MKWPHGMTPCIILSDTGCLLSLQQTPSLAHHSLSALLTPSLFLLPRILIVYLLHTLDPPHLSAAIFNRLPTLEHLVPFRIIIPRLLDHRPAEIPARGMDPRPRRVRMCCCLVRLAHGAGPAIRTRRRAAVGRHGVALAGEVVRHLLCLFSRRSHVMF